MRSRIIATEKNNSEQNKVGWKSEWNYDECLLVSEHNDRKAQNEKKGGKSLCTITSC